MSAQKVMERPSIPCKVCAAPESRYHFGGYCCESCAAFFSRTVERRLVFHCYLGGHCGVGPSRSKYVICKACRFRRCLEQGMRPEDVSRKKVRQLMKRRHVELDLDETGSLRSQSKQIIAVPSFEKDLQGTLISSPRISDIRAGYESYIPPGTPLHGFFTQSPGFVQETVRAVQWAAYVAYNDQIASDSDFMNMVLTTGQTPTQPEQSVEMTYAYIAGLVDEIHHRAQLFASLLPGYTTYASLKQKHNIVERFPGIATVQYAGFIKDGELYWRFGPKKAHFCRYWRDSLLNKDMNAYNDNLMLELNSLQLTMTEKFVLIAIHTFQPKSFTESSDDVENQVLSTLIGRYWMTLEYLLRSRHQSEQFNRIMMRVRDFLCHLIGYEKIVAKYKESAAKKAVVISQEAEIFEVLTAAGEVDAGRS